MIRTRRFNDPGEPGDGLRVLITRYRPRGLPRSEETWDEWWKDLGPSVELHADFYGKHGPPIGWVEYRRRYLEEIERPEAAEKIAELSRRHAAGETITLLCSSACTDPAHCHRTLLADMIEKRARRTP